MKNCLICLIVLIWIVLSREKRVISRSRHHKAGQGMILPFHSPMSWAKYNVIHPHGAKITKSSHFSQSFKLGYKILLVCEAKGKPLPSLLWYKDGSEVPQKLNTHFYEKRIGRRKAKSKIEIDPATLGDQGIYVCIASNPYAFDHRSFKTEYYY